MISSQQKPEEKVINKTVNDIMKNLVQDSYFDIKTLLLTYVMLKSVSKSGISTKRSFQKLSNWVDFKEGAYWNSKISVAECLPIIIIVAL